MKSTAKTTKTRRRLMVALAALASASCLDPIALAADAPDPSRRSLRAAHRPAPGLVVPIIGRPPPRR